MTKAFKITHLQRAEQERDRLLERLAKFGEQFAKDPAYALEWSADAFRDAAQLKVWKFVAATMTGRPEVTLTQIADHLFSEGMRLARYNSRSTSPASNLCEDEYRVATFEVAERLRSWATLDTSEAA